MTGSSPSPAPRTEDGSSLARTHLVGVGGAGMSGIARILVDRGLPVSGSDAKGSHVLTGLAQRGVRTAIGHDPAHLDLLDGGPTAVVVSTAIRPANPEVVAARERGIPVVLRAEALAALMTGSRSVCVAGTHGKTSTTSMLTVALQRCGLDPSFMIGGELNESGSGAHQGSGDIFVAEADESDGSFLAFTPHGAVVTNLEPDHLDHHGTAEAYAAVFEQFVDRIAPGGFLVACTDDPGVSRLLAAIGSGPGAPRVISFGFTGRPDYLVSSHSSIGHGTAATITVPGGGTVPLTLAVPGVHMLSNAIGALAAGIALGVPAQQMAAGLAGYTGVRRRFEFKGREAGVAVYDDYAHHPTEVAAQLLAARTVLAGDLPSAAETLDAATGPPGALTKGAGAGRGVGPADGPRAGRLVVVFQPHLYSRTVTFAADFAHALAAADVVVVLDVYGAREDPRPGVTGELISRQVPPGPQVHFLPSLAAVPTQVADLTRPGDLVITMGAGDVTMIGPQLLEVLARR